MKLPKILNKIGDLIFPNVCVGCQREIAASGQVLCFPCTAEMPFTDQFDHKENAFTRHFWGRLPVVDGAALLIYSPKEISQKIVHNFKYRNRKNIGTIMGKMIGNRINKSINFNAIELIIPVPLTKRRLYERGYNQSKILSLGIGEECDLTVEDNVLIRTKNTQSQTNKTRIDRINNMTDAFKIKSSEKIKDKHILLVDDVMTTGATLESCALELLKHASQISMVTLALGK